MNALRPPELVDQALVLLCFLGPTFAVWLYIVLREIGRLRRWRRDLKLEEEISIAEGFPPPGPPTT